MIVVGKLLNLIWLGSGRKLTVSILIAFVAYFIHAYFEALILEEELMKRSSGEVIQLSERDVLTGWIVDAIGWAAVVLPFVGLILFRKR